MIATKTTATPTARNERHLAIAACLLRGLSNEQIKRELNLNGSSANNISEAKAAIRAALGEDPYSGVWAIIVREIYERFGSKPIEKRCEVEPSQVQGWLDGAATPNARHQDTIKKLYAATFALALNEDLYDLEDLHEQMREEREIGAGVGRVR